MKKRTAAEKKAEQEAESEAGDGDSISHKEGGMWMPAGAMSEEEGCRRGWSGCNV